MTSWNSFARPLSIAALTAAAVFLSACVTQPPRDNSALRNLDNDLAEFRADTELSDRVPLELASAERAVRAAHSEGLSEAELSHRIQLAGKRLEIARAEAFRVQAREQTAALEAERIRLLLHASRLEVGRARREAGPALLQGQAAGRVRLCSRACSASRRAWRTSRRSRTRPAAKPGRQRRSR